MLDLRPLALTEVLELVPHRFGDRRGFFAEAFNRERFAARGVAVDWVQDNQSYSAEPFTLRGLHFQTPPFAQAKLVRVLRGRIWDVAVDIRAGSPTFGQWAALEISAEAFNQIYVPTGFAHGFLTLEPDTEILYKVSAPYSAAHDRSLRFDDPAFRIPWPLDGRVPVLSDKDRDAPRLADAASPFVYESQP